MATLISDELKWTARQIVTNCGYPSAVLSGLAPDRRHLDNGGFHCSVADLRAYGNSNDYSNTRSNDRNFNINYGAAFDVSMSKTDMIKAYGRVYRVWADRSDPRRKFVNAINGWDGSGDAIRLDFDAGTAKRASDDHRWHNHGEMHRRWVRDPKAARAIVSIYQGELKAAWIAREEPEMQEDDVLNADDKKWLSAEIAKQVKTAVDGLAASLPTASEIAEAMWTRTRTDVRPPWSDTARNLFGAEITEAVKAGTVIERFPANKGK